MVQNRQYLIPVIFTLALLVLNSCGSSKDSTDSMTTEERYNIGMEALADEDYQKALENFEVILLQDPANNLADDAQFYLAETYYKQGEYYTAAFQYSRVLNDFPGSPYYKRALFMTGECYFEISPQFERDQSKTETAIRQYNAFVGYFPNDSLTTVARQRVVDLRSRLAERDYSVGQHYLKREQYKAADLYFQRVVDRYPDTQFYQLAVEALVTVKEKTTSSQEASQSD